MRAGAMKHANEPDAASPITAKKKDLHRMALTAQKVFINPFENKRVLCLRD